MEKFIRKILILLLIIGSSCADVDYVQYYNYYYINATKYNFDKIIVYANNENAEYQINKDDTLLFKFSENDIEPLLIGDYVDSIDFYYNGIVKRVKEHNSIGHIKPVWEYQFYRNGKHDEINNDYYIFTEKYFY